MARLHAENRYDRRSNDFERVTGHWPMSVRDFVVRHANQFTSSRQNE
jgi:hypothetical protein